MCRFILYVGTPITLASLITEPSHSLINQSVRARESDEPMNGDGFGVGWYVPELSNRPAVFRSITPAWNNQNLLDLARVTRTGVVLAHVRAATRGQPVTELNCHPFASGPYCFMHNGDIGGFSAVRRRLQATLRDDPFNAIRGSTDSEHLFALFLNHTAGGRAHGAAAMAYALERAIRDVLSMQADAGVEEPSYLNVAVSDGKEAVVCRFTTDIPEHAASLYLHSGRRYICVGGACRMIQPEAGQGAVIVASEPLSDDPGWAVIQPNTMVLIREDRTTQAVPVRRLAEEAA